MYCYVTYCYVMNCYVMYCYVMCCCDVLLCDVLLSDVLLLHCTSPVFRKIAPQLPLTIYTIQIFNVYTYIHIYNTYAYTEAYTFYPVNMSNLNCGHLGGHTLFLNTAVTLSIAIPTSVD